MKLLILIIIAGHLLITRGRAAGAICSGQACSWTS